MKNKFKLSSLLILVMLFVISCQKESVLPENEIDSKKTENSKFKSSTQFEFGIVLFTQDELNGPVVPATGSIIIESNSSVIYTGQLAEGGNRIQVSEKSNYTISVEKEGYVAYAHNFTYSELEVHKIQRYTVPLEVVLEKVNPTVSLIGSYGIKGKETEIAISTSELEATLNINSYQLSLSYEPTYLNFVGYNLTGTLDEGAIVNIVNDSTAGTLTIISNSASILSGSGNLINLEFTAQTQGATTFSIDSFSYSSLEVTDLNGKSLNIYHYGDVDNDGQILVQDVSIVGNYVIGHPIAGISIPWEAWRIEVADVDGDLDVDNDDMYLILDYWQGVINEFPVENATD